MLEAGRFDLVFLDLKLPGLDGIEVLRRTMQAWPRMRVVVITAPGTVTDAALAMKLGAADFIQKPFTPEEIRVLTESLFRQPPENGDALGYIHCLTEARRSITENRLATAVAFLRKAVGLDPSRPEAFNLLGAAVHLGGQRSRAQIYFRAAIALDPTYRPAQENLERSAGGGVRGLPMDLSLGAGPEEGR